ncbi:proliferation marker protein Ki-67-like isoform X2 [Wyeomyia smithii]|uniref:proliferation marker protein Ki-67-like isoform X2 n=1 Tax=Wyeomyia smithii TaxID=174621 RepID=UPI0024681745|nr:proliferation marker protein Ki-67-like isoform X2 [Wyeomyia smithii]
MVFNGARLLVLEKGDAINREIPIRTSQVKFGSHPLNTIRLKSKAADRLHCKIFAKNEKVIIINYSSERPIQIDGNIVRKRSVLNNGSILEVCGTRFRWLFDESQLCTQGNKTEERTPTSTRYGKRRRTTMLQNKQKPITDKKSTTCGKNKKSLPKKSNKTPVYTLPKSRQQLLNNIRKRFTVHNIVGNHQFDDEESDYENMPDNTDQLSKTPVSTNVTISNNTPFYTPEMDKENTNFSSAMKITKTPALQLENSAMMILSYTPSSATRSKAHVMKTPLSVAKTKCIQSPRMSSENLSPITPSKSSNVSKAGNSMYLIDLTTPGSGHSRSYACSPLREKNSLSQSSVESSGLIDLITPSPKKSRLPSSAMIKSTQKVLLKSALKNASKTPRTLLVGTPKPVPKIVIDNSISKSLPIRKINDTSNTHKSRVSNFAASPVSSKKTSGVRVLTQSPKIVESKQFHSTEGTVSENNIQLADTETDNTPAMTTDELFDTLLGRHSVKKTYTRKSDSPKKNIVPLIGDVGCSSELPKTDIDLWVESAVETTATAKIAEVESAIRKPNRTTQIRSSQYSDITPHESFVDVLTVATVSERLSSDLKENDNTDETGSEVPKESELENLSEIPVISNQIRRSHTPLASKIVRTLDNKRQTIGSFFTNIFGKLTVSPVTKLNITDDYHNSEEDEEQEFSGTDSDESEEVYHESETGLEGNINQQQHGTDFSSPKLRQSLRNTRKFIGNALTSLNTSKSLVENIMEFDESLLLNETGQINESNGIDDEGYDLTDLSSALQTEHSTTSPIANKLILTPRTRRFTRKTPVCEKSRIDNSEVINSTQKGTPQCISSDGCSSPANILRTLRKSSLAISSENISTEDPSKSISNNQNTSHISDELEKSSARGKNVQCSNTNIDKEVQNNQTPVRNACFRNRKSMFAAHQPVINSTPNKIVKTHSKTSIHETSLITDEISICSEFANQFVSDPKTGTNRSILGTGEEDKQKHETPSSLSPVISDNGNITASSTFDGSESHCENISSPVNDKLQNTGSSDSNNSTVSIPSTRRITRRTIAAIVNTPEISPSKYKDSKSFCSSKPSTAQNAIDKDIVVNDVTSEVNVLTVNKPNTRRMARKTIATVLNTPKTYNVKHLPTSESKLPLRKLRSAHTAHANAALTLPIADSISTNKRLSGKRECSDDTNSLFLVNKSKATDDTILHNDEDINMQQSDDGVQQDAPALEVFNEAKILSNEIGKALESMPNVIDEVQPAELNLSQRQEEYDTSPISCTSFLVTSASATPVETTAPSTVTKLSSSVCLQRDDVECIEESLFFQQKVIDTFDKVGSVDEGASSSINNSTVGIRSIRKKTRNTINAIVSTPKTFYVAEAPLSETKLPYRVLRSAQILNDSRLSDKLECLENVNSATLDDINKTKHGVEISSVELSVKQPNNDNQADESVNLEGTASPNSKIFESTILDKSKNAKTNVSQSQQVDEALLHDNETTSYGGISVRASSVLATPVKTRASFSNITRSTRKQTGSTVETDFMVDVKSIEKPQTSEQDEVSNVQNITESEKANDINDSTIGVSSSTGMKRKTVATVMRTPKQPIMKNASLSESKLRANAIASSSPLPTIRPDEKNEQLSEGLHCTEKSDASILVGDDSADSTELSPDDKSFKIMMLNSAIQTNSPIPEKTLEIRNDTTPNRSRAFSKSFSSSLTTSARASPSVTSAIPSTTMLSSSACEQKYDDKENKTNIEKTIANIFDEQSSNKSLATERELTEVSMIQNIDGAGLSIDVSPAVGHWSSKKMARKTMAAIPRTPEMVRVKNTPLSESKLTLRVLRSARVIANEEVSSRSSDIDKNETSSSEQKECTNSSIPNDYSETTYIAEVAPIEKSLNLERLFTSVGIDSPVLESGFETDLMPEEIVKPIHTVLDESEIATVNHSKAEQIDENLHSENNSLEKTCSSVFAACESETPIKTRVFSVSITSTTSVSILERQNTPNKGQVGTPDGKYEIQSTRRTRSVALSATPLSKRTIADNSLSETNVETKIPECTSPLEKGFEETSLLKNNVSKFEISSNEENVLYDSKDPSHVNELVFFSQTPEANLYQNKDSSVERNESASEHKSFCLVYKTDASNRNSLPPARLETPARFTRASLSLKKNTSQITNMMKTPMRNPPSTKTVTPDSIATPHDCTSSAAGDQTQKEQQNLSLVQLFKTPLRQTQNSPCTSEMKKFEQRHATPISDMILEKNTFSKNNVEEISMTPPLTALFRTPARNTSTPYVKSIASSNKNVLHNSLESVTEHVLNETPFRSGITPETNEQTQERSNNLSHSYSASSISNCKRSEVEKAENSLEMSVVCNLTPMNKSNVEEERFVGDEKFSATLPFAETSISSEASGSNETSISLNPLFKTPSRTLHENTSATSLSSARMTIEKPNVVSEESFALKKLFETPPINSTSVTNCNNSQLITRSPNVDTTLETSLISTDRPKPTRLSRLARNSTANNSPSSIKNTHTPQRIPLGNHTSSSDKNNATHEPENPFISVSTANDHDLLGIKDTHETEESFTERRNAMLLPASQTTTVTNVSCSHKDDFVNISTSEVSNINATSNRSTESEDGNVQSVDLTLEPVPQLIPNIDTYDESVPNTDQTLATPSKTLSDTTYQTPETNLNQLFKTPASQRSAVKNKTYSTKTTIVLEMNETTVENVAEINSVENAESELNLSHSKCEKTLAVEEIVSINESLLKNICERVVSLEQEFDALQETCLNDSNSIQDSLNIEPSIETPNHTVSVDDGISPSLSSTVEISNSTKSTAQNKRKLYTRNDPDNTTPENRKSIVTQRMSSSEYLSMLNPTTKPEDSMNPESPGSNFIPSSRKDKDTQKRVLPSRASRRNIKTLSEEALAGASPEVKFVKPKPIKIDSCEDDSSKSLLSETESLEDNFAGKRKVTFKDRIQIREINSPAIVGDIIQNVSSKRRGRTRLPKITEITTATNNDELPSTVLSGDPAPKQTRRGLRNKNSTVSRISTRSTRHSKNTENKAECDTVPVVPNNDEKANAADPTAIVSQSDQELQHDSPYKSNNADVVINANQQILLETESKTKPLRVTRKTTKTVQTKKAPNDTRIKNVEEIKLTNDSMLQSTDNNISTQRTPSAGSNEENETTMNIQHHATRKPTRSAKSSSKRTATITTGKLEQTEIPVADNAETLKQSTIQVNNEQPPKTLFESNDNAEPITTRRQYRTTRKQTRNAGALSQNAEVEQSKIETTNTTELNNPNATDVDVNKTKNKRVTKKSTTAGKQMSKERDDIGDSLTFDDNDHEPNTDSGVITVGSDVKLDILFDSNGMPPKRERRPLRRKQDSNGSKEHLQSTNSPAETKRSVRGKRKQDNVIETGTAMNVVDSSETTVESSETGQIVQLNEKPQDTKSRRAAHKKPTNKRPRQQDKISTSETEESITNERIETSAIVQATNNSTKQDETENVIPPKQNRRRAPPKKSAEETIQEIVIPSTRNEESIGTGDEYQGTRKRTFRQLTKNPAFQEPPPKLSKRSQRKPKQDNTADLRHNIEESLNESHMVKTMLSASHTSTPLPKVAEESESTISKLKPTRTRTKKLGNPIISALVEEELNQQRRSPRNRRGKLNADEHEPSIAEVSETTTLPRNDAKEEKLSKVSLSVDDKVPIKSNRRGIKSQAATKNKNMTPPKRHRENIEVVDEQPTKKNKLAEIYSQNESDLSVSGESVTARHTRKRTQKNKSADVVEAESTDTASRRRPVRSRK